MLIQIMSSGAPLRRGLRVLGHPLHPALAHLPMGLLPASLVWDAVALWRGEPVWWAMAFWTLALGIAGAGVAAVAGSLDYLAIDDERKGAKRVATAHLLVMLAAAGLFAISFVVRGSPEPPDPSLRRLAVALSAAGTLAIAVGGWLGGHLVYGHRVGVDERSRGS